jgi:O-antigen ligase
MRIALPSGDGDQPMAWLTPTAAVLPIAAPMLLAVNLPPSPTLLNQCVAIALWGAWACLLSQSNLRFVRPASIHPWRDTVALDVALLALVACAASTVALGPLPLGFGVLTVATLFAAMLVCHLSSATAAGSRGRLFDLVLLALVFSAVISALIALVQVFAPQWSDGDFIARSSLPGRAVGNLRQPNHLSTLLLWGLIAALGLHGRSWLNRWAGLVLVVLLTLALVLTASRTAVLGVLLLVAWGALDKRLAPRLRVALLLLPLLYAVFWFGLMAWGHSGHHEFSGEGRMTLGSTGDISSSRFAIWSNTLKMIHNEPWTGVGFGEFNIAWTLTELPDRPTAFFDHTHNLPLQLLVELGIPLGSLVIVLLLVALVQAARRAWACDGDEGLARRAAFMIVLMIGLHSMLEYPLWYAYFLLPTAFAWGFALSRPNPSELVLSTVGQGAASASPPAMSVGSRTLALAGLAMAIGAAAAVLDYWRVVVIYDPPEVAAPLEERIERGQRSPLFGQHADYAAATAFGEPKAPLSPSQQLAFKRAPHQLLDVRLMIAWSQALAAQGELDKARWLAARIREFRNPGADEFFAPCQRPELAAQAFQCQPPQRVVNWREFTEQH